MNTGTTLVPQIRMNIVIIRASIKKTFQKPVLPKRLARPEERVKNYFTLDKESK